MRNVLLLALAGLVIGAALGLLIGWVLWPVRYTNVSPTDLRQDYHNDYVLMVAAAYRVDGDLEAARARLALLDPEAPARPVATLAEELVAANGPPNDVAMLAALAEALAAAPSPTPALLSPLASPTGGTP